MYTHSLPADCPITAVLLCYRAVVLPYCCLLRVCSAMHRPRAVTTEGWKAAGEILTIVSRQGGSKGQLQPPVSQLQQEALLQLCAVVFVCRLISCCLRVTAAAVSCALGQQWDEKLPSIFSKLIGNNISCLPVLDQHRRYMGLLDTQAIVIHALKAFGIMVRQQACSWQRLVWQHRSGG